MTSRNIHRTLLIGALLFLSGCALWKQPDYKGMPDKDSIISGEEITVGANENVYGIARKYNVSMREIIVLNDLKAPFALKSGQRLMLPSRQADFKTVKSAPVTSIEAMPLDPIQGSSVSAMPLSEPTSTMDPTPLTPTEVQKPLPLETTVSKTKSLAQQKIVEDSGDVTGFIAIPPVQGPIISTFGSKGAGTTNDGINIGAPKGSTVVASSRGMVVYAGSEMKGFGNLVLIRHEGGWVTAYAHLDRIMVAKDAIVAAGDQIGTVGTSGGVTTPQLHFEARLNGKPMDPQTVLKQTD